MIIGHLPAGYILSKLSLNRFSRYIENCRAWIFWGIFGSIAPDLDMMYFHFIDHRQRNHHKYVSHYPLVWIILIIMSLVRLKFSHGRRGVYMTLFSVSGFIHILLDSIVGDVWIFAPFIDQPYAIATVPARFHPWWLNFIIHWSFFLEIAVVIWAVWIWKKDPHPCMKKDLGSAQNR